MEVFKPINKYSNYQISSYGRVKRDNKILSNVNCHGYLTICLYKHGKAKRFLIHRLVADAFLPKIEGKNIVNHKDENKQNNHVDNLEWCDYKYNSNYGNAKLIISKKLKGNKNNVVQEESRKYILCIETGEIYHKNEWVKRGFTNVSKVINGKQKTCKKYHFEKLGGVVARW